MTSSRLPEIRVYNRQRKLTVERGPLETFARQALPVCIQAGGLGLTSLAVVEVVLVSDHTIRKLHRRFLRIDQPTDVITFQHGEIFISVETAQRQATTHQTSLESELRLYLVHGLLHLQGFDDHEPEARRRMGVLQEKIVAAARLAGGSNG
jgi:probable rRNA maturation factor